MSRKRGGARLAPRKGPSVGAILLPILALVLIAAALMYYFRIPAFLFGRDPAPAEPIPAQASAPPQQPEAQPPALPQPDARPSEEVPAQEVTQPEPEPEPEPLPGLNTPLEPVTPEEERPHGELYSESALLLNLDTGTVLFEQDADVQRYPASLTKILTAYTVLESGIDTDLTVTVTGDMVAGLLEADASVAGYAAGDQVTVEELLYGLMLPSGADCAHALAVTVSGNIPDFVAQMNETAKSLDMTGSHFVNPTGLHDEAQYSTARDLCKLLTAALKNDLFHKIYTTAAYHLSATASQPNGIDINNYILFSSDIDFPGGTLVGAKTGFTTPAGQCLSSIAETEEGGHYLLVTMGAGKEFAFIDKYSLADALYLYSRVAQQEAALSGKELTNEYSDNTSVDPEIHG